VIYTADAMIGTLTWMVIGCKFVLSINAGKSKNDLHFRQALGKKNGRRLQQAGVF
jgi:hypothetical protein